MITTPRKLNTELAQPTNENTAAQAWLPVLDALKKVLPEQAFHTWFEPMQPVFADDNGIVVEIPSRFYYEWIEGHYSSLLDDVLNQELGGRDQLNYLLSSHTSEPEQPALYLHEQADKTELSANGNSGVHEVSNKPAATAKDNGLPHSHYGLNARYTFDTFIEGPQNQFAKAAARAVASSPGTTSYNPLLIYGGVGLGKTHLLQAIGHAVASRNGGLRVRYISSELFTQEFVEAVKSNQGDRFSARYRDIDVLLMDDVQLLVGRDRTLMEFFHIFNALHQAGKQIVLSSDKPPRELQGLDERLVSRFGWGLVCDIAPPDFDTRVAIIENVADNENVSLNKDVIEFIASQFSSNVREMQGAIIRLVAHASLTGTDIGLETAKQALRDLIKTRERNVTIDEVQRAVAEHFNVAPDLLLAKIRTQPIARARMVAMALCLRLCRLPLKHVGAHFGGRDHTTVLHARNTVQKWEDEDDQFASELKGLIRRIETETA